jgi:hypothetical protein
MNVKVTELNALLQDVHDQPFKRPVKNKHVFDVRSEFAVRDIKAKRSKRSLLCLKCKKLVQDPSSSCRFVEGK